MLPLLVLSGICLLGAALLFLLGRSRTPEDVVYTDAPSVSAPLLVSETHGLKGKPDAVYRLSGAYIPVERKSRPAPKRPYESEMIQAAVYGLLVEEHYGHAPPFLRLEYSDGTIDVPFTASLRADVLAYAAVLRQARGTLPGRSHQIRAKCAGCVQRGNCGQAL
jgi:predicted RecB family nuclease